jgi:hypothetical protein
MALDRLGQCLEENNCDPGADTVILLASYHFGKSPRPFRSEFTVLILRSAKPDRLDLGRRDLVSRLTVVAMLFSKD